MDPKTEAYQNAMQDLLDIRWELKSLANSFLTVGNPHVGGRLLELSNIIEDDMDAIRSHVSDLVFDGFKQAEQHSFNILKTILVMADQKNPSN